MAKYKDVGDKYKYQKELERVGYMKFRAFTYDSLPDGYDWPTDCDLQGWPMRNAIKEWAKDQWFEDYKIARANGYWRDLHGDYVYEVWVNKREYRKWLSPNNK